MTRLGCNQGNTVYSRAGIVAALICLPCIARGRGAGNRLFHVLSALAPTPIGAPMTPQQVLGPCSSLAAPALPSLQFAKTVF